MTVLCDVCQKRPAKRSITTSAAGETSICDECSRGVYPGTSCKCRVDSTHGAKLHLHTTGCPREAVRTVDVPCLTNPRQMHEIPMCEPCAEWHEAGGRWEPIADRAEKELLEYLPKYDTGELFAGTARCFFAGRFAELVGNNREAIEWWELHANYYGARLARAFNDAHGRKATPLALVRGNGHG